MLTRADFNEISSALKTANPGEPDSTAASEGYDQWFHDVRAVADALATTNPRFDRQRFIEQCTS